MLTNKNSIASSTARLLLALVPLGLSSIALGQAYDNSQYVAGPSAAPSSNPPLSFQTNEFTGSFSYSLPIELPPARAGAMPSLALSYTSGGANGWIGVGWDLDVGYIERDTRKGTPLSWTTGSSSTPAQTSTGLPYDASAGYTFSFHGRASRLVATTVANEFAAEIDQDFLKFVLVNPTSANNYWEVTDKHGTKYRFGSTGDSANSQLTNPQSTVSDATKVFRWGLALSTDTNGNRVKYEYAAQPGGNVYRTPLYLSKISYNGHTSGAYTHAVDFALEDRGGIAPNDWDDTLSFRGGFRQETRKRLKSITLNVLDQGVWTRARQYSLTYTQSPSTKRSMLASVAELGKTGTSAIHTPITFTYSTQTFRFDDPIQWGPLQHQVNPPDPTNTLEQFNALGCREAVALPSSEGSKGKLELLDIDRDGLPDRVLVDRIYTIPGNPPAKYLVQHNKYGLSTPSVTYTFDQTLRNYAFLAYSGVSYPQMRGGTGWTGPSGYPYCTDLDMGKSYLKLMDINGDGFVDRVHDWRRGSTSQIAKMYVEFGNGHGFDPVLSEWLPIADQTALTGSTFNPNYFFGPWNGPEYTMPDCDRTGGAPCNPPACPGSPGIYNVGALVTTLMDVNGDGLPDRVVRRGNETLATRDHFLVQINTGTGFQTNFRKWSFATPYVVDQYFWNNIMTFETGLQTAPNTSTPVGMFDMNGDGLPDRLMRLSAPTGNGYDKFAIQYNTGYGWTSFDGSALSYFGPLGNPDSPTGSFVPYDYASCSDSADIASGGPSGSFTCTMLQDVNADGLLDRVLQKKSPGTAAGTYVMWVQINQGTKFSAPIQYDNFVAIAAGPVPGYPGPWHYLQAGTGYNSANDHGTEEVVGYRDINGDGLPDRIMREPNAPYSVGLRVQLAHGDSPDLLKQINNGLGGSIAVAYKPANQYVNRTSDVGSTTTDPWASGSAGTLTAPLQTVSQVTVSDGIGPAAVTKYDYYGGFYDFKEREFRGFYRVTKTDAANMVTKTWFHQDGGLDGSTLGEFNDTIAGTGVLSHSKRGMPFRIESYDDQNHLMQVVVNKVDEFQIGTINRWSPYTKRTATLNYEGLGTPRTTVQDTEVFTSGQFTTNLKKQSSLGEFTGYVAQTHNGTNLVPSDDLFHVFTYATGLGGGEIRDRVDLETFEAPLGTQLRKTDNDYDATTGNLMTSMRWRDLPTGVWLSDTFTYDPYGNVVNHTRPGAGTPANPSGAGELVTQHTDWDANYHAFPETVVDDYGTGTFNYSKTTVFDPYSGQPHTSEDWNDVVTRNEFDNFNRIIEVWLDLPAGGGSIWQQTFDYDFGGVAGGLSFNLVHRAVNDASDPTQTLGVGHDTFTYSDGLGRVVQSRVESERSTPMQYYRVADTRYDPRGNRNFETREHFLTGIDFSSLTGSEAATTTLFDALGRAKRLTPPTGDANSPTGFQTTDFFFGTNPWARVIKDGKKNSTGTGLERREYRDAFARVEKIEELGPSGAVYTTLYQYNPFGDLKEVKDHLLNTTTYTYDSLGRRLTTVDPDLVDQTTGGSITTSYFDDGNVKTEVDGNGATTSHLYDRLGRTVSSKTFISTGARDEQFDYTYDVNNDGTSATFPVFKGQLFKVSDIHGFTRNGYDVRGHVLRTLRNVSSTGANYTTQYTYDIAGRVATMTYPSGLLAKLQYTYDTGGNLKTIQSLAGTRATEVFYDVQQFDELRQPERVDYGNGVANYFTYYPNSKRLQSARAQLGSNPDYQNLSYTYDAASNVTSITDSVVGHSGVTSGTRSNIQYDPLYRVTSYQRPVAAGMQTSTFTYNALGNMLTNADAGAGSYVYPASGTNSVRPHAVTSAPTGSFAYDNAGNMTTRGPLGSQQTLAYNARNLLKSVTSAASTVTFGYDAAGKRLWKLSGSSLTVFVGEHFEDRGPYRQLCHVIADGKRICTFQPLGNPMPIEPVVVGQPAPPPLVFDYYHQDQLKTCCVMSNRDGSLAQEYQYTAYGAEVYVQNTTDYPLYNRFTDQYWDTEVGLYYYGHRYYDPVLGRFIQADNQTPNVYDPQGLNRYSYVLNNPFRYIDPTGHSWWDSIKSAATNFVKGAVLGDFAGEDLGIAGLIGQVAVGLSPLGVLADIRDFAAAGVKVIKGEASLGELALAGANLVPGVSEGRKVAAVAGVASEVGEQALKHIDDVEKVGAKAIRVAEEGKVNSGIYEFIDAKTGKTYVGQSGDIDRRIAEHGDRVASDVKRTEVIGGKTERELAEQRRINELTAGKGAQSGELANKRNSVSRDRADKLGEDVGYAPKP